MAGSGGKTGIGFRPFEVGMTLGLIVNDTKLMSSQILQVLLESFEKSLPKTETIDRLAKVAGVDKTIAAKIVREFWKEDYLNLDMPLKRRVCESLKGVILDVSKFLLEQVKGVFPPELWKNKDFLAGYRLGLQSGLSDEEIDELIAEINA